MENENNSIEETLTQDTDTEVTIDLDENVEDDDTTDWKAEAEKNRKAYEDQKKRAEIAESKVKQPKTEVRQAHKEESGLSTIDTIAIVRANIDTEDIDEVTNFARYQKISVSDALKSSALKAILAEKKEKRTVAQASHSGTARRSTSTISDDALLANASKGILPESDADFERLAELRTKRK